MFVTDGATTMRCVGHANTLHPVVETTPKCYLEINELIASTKLVL